MPEERRKKRVWGSGQQAAEAAVVGLGLRRM